MAGELKSSEKIKYGDSIHNAMRLVDEEGYSYGIKHTENRPHQIPYVWNSVTLAFEAATQTTITTGSLSVSSDTDLKKIGGAAVGASNALHVQPGTGASFAATVSALPLPTGAAQDGTDITTPTAMPTGGVGIRGWLSAIWTKLNGSITETNSGNIKTAVEKIPAQGQADASASLPVVLPAAQVTTLTPPAAITGFATSAKQLPDGHSVAVASLPAIPHDPLTASDVVQVTGGAGQTADVKMTLDSEVVEVSGMVSSELPYSPPGLVIPLSLTPDRMLRVVSSIVPTFLDFFGDFNPFGDADHFGGSEGYLKMSNHPWAGL